MQGGRRSDTGDRCTLGGRESINDVPESSDLNSSPQDPNGSRPRARAITAVGSDVER